jgi:hypothetical protein
MRESWPLKDCPKEITQKRIHKLKVKGKGKVHPRTCHEGPKGGVDVKLYSFFNLGFRWRWVVNAMTRPLYLRKRPGTPYIGGWMGPRAVLDGYAKSPTHRDSIPGRSSP